MQTAWFNQSVNKHTSGECPNFQWNWNSIMQRHRWGNAPIIGHILCVELYMLLILTQTLEINTIITTVQVKKCSQESQNWQRAWNQTHYCASLCLFSCLIETREENELHAKMKGNLRLNPSPWLLWHLSPDYNNTLLLSVFLFPLKTLIECICLEKLDPAQEFDVENLQIADQFSCQSIWKIL